MGWILTLITLLIQYGPAIYSLVKAILELIKWHKGAQSTMPGAHLAGIDLDGDLRSALGRFKLSKDDTELKAMCAQLQMHKNNTMMGQ